MRQQAYALSQLDAFFVAYQERAGILMQHGVEVEVKAELRRAELEQVLSHLVARWPRLGQTLHKGLTGLRWRGECRVEKMLRVADERGALAGWRNQSIDPFHEPPFQLLYLPGGPERSTLAFRAHHAVADGESFVVICMEALRLLALMKNGETLPHAEPAASHSLAQIISLAALWRERRLPGMWRYMRWLGAEAKAGRSMSLNMRARAPGQVATRERLLDETDFACLNERALSQGVSPAWLCAAAWVRAIGSWNRSRSIAATSLVSLEVPVSLRPRRNLKDYVGNFISPLVLFGDSSRSLDSIALGLQEQFRTQVRRRSHLSVPLFTAPARLLPWPLFRRLALNQASTGFATSHFIWLRRAIDRELAALSRGAFELLDFHLYTPVCLHMGAALAVIPFAGAAKLVLTYRVTAFSAAEAESLLDLAAAELRGEQRQQRQAAV